MNVLEKTLKILEQPVCDHCLGRQFGNLLSGYDNTERGKNLRQMAAMSIDKEDYSGKIDLSNFYLFRFHNLNAKKEKPKKCSVCSNLFETLEKFIDKIAIKSKNYEFDTFLIGTKISSDLLEKEESLWERAGIDYCEPIKAEINREMGKKLEKKLGKKFSTRPDINFIIDIHRKKINIEINPIFIYGEYQKLKRGIPQTKWPSGKYKTSVEQIVAKPYMKISKGKGHKFHGLGREDIDARCLAWRPFVLEIMEPKKRKLNIKKLAKKIRGKVNIRQVRFSNIEEVRRIKEIKLDKTYRTVVASKKPLEKKDLKKLSLLKMIKQKTPQRVLHRRADLYRNRKVLFVRTKLLSARKFELTVKGEAGLYIKELISGDNGRTRPSVSGILNNECICKELDVVKIHKK